MHGIAWHISVARSTLIKSIFSIFFFYSSIRKSELVFSLKEKTHRLHSINPDFPSPTPGKGPETRPKSFLIDTDSRGSWQAMSPLHEKKIPSPAHGTCIDVLYNRVIHRSMPYVPPTPVAATRGFSTFNLKTLK